MTGKRKVVLVVLLLVTAGGIYVYKEYNRTNTNIAEQSSAYSVNAVELLTEFAANDSAASKKYVGKIISVMGTVKSLNQDDHGLYTVNLGDSTSLSSVRCSVDSMYSVRAGSLQPGVQVTLKGNCTGYNEDEMLGSDVIVNRCLVEKSNK